MINSDFIDQMREATKRKVGLLDNHFIKFALRSLYAGVFLSFATVCAILAAGLLYDINPILSKFIYAIIFPFALIMIVTMNAELATSNMMYMSVAVHQKFINIKKGLQLIIVCTSFNWLGAILAVYLMSFATSSDQFANQAFLMNLIQAKLEKSNLSLFIEAILANMFVNIAIIGQLKIQNEIAKFFFIEILIFMFAFLGYEHVVANFSIHSIAFFKGHFLPYGTVLSQWFLAFFGNLVGGGILIGVIYSFLNSNTINQLDK